MLVVVRVNQKEGAPRMVIVPNPVQKGDVLLQLSNLPRDRYKMTLYNAKGQVVQEGFVEHAGGSGSYPLRIDHLLSGIYIIELASK